jgi:hypothetical protein
MLGAPRSSNATALLLRCIVDAAEIDVAQKAE